MNASKLPLVGPGRFQWNAGAWFGSSLGSSAWMLVTACFLLINGQAILASITATGYVLILSVSVLLWARRQSIHPFSALMTLLGLLAIAFPAVWFVVQSCGSQSVLAAMNWPQSRWTTILVLAIVPVHMVWFLILERLGTLRKTDAKHNSNAVA